MSIGLLGLILLVGGFLAFCVLLAVKNSPQATPAAPCHSARAHASASAGVSLLIASEVTTRSGGDAQLTATDVSANSLPAAALPVRP